jgi:hypothetical protein
MHKGELLSTDSMTKRLFVLSAQKGLVSSVHLFAQADTNKKGTWLDSIE